MDATDIALLSKVLRIPIPARLADLLVQDRPALGGRPLLRTDLASDPGCIYGATRILWTARPDLAGTVIVLYGEGDGAVCARASGDDPEIVHVPVAAGAKLSTVADSLSGLLSQTPAHGVDEGPAISEERAGRRAALAALGDELAEAESEEAGLERLCARLGLELPLAAREALLSPAPTALEGLQYRFRGPTDTPPSVVWALRAMLEGVDEPPDDLIPILPCDSMSFACAVASHRASTSASADGPRPDGPHAKGPPFADSEGSQARTQTTSFTAGAVVRWHLAEVPARGQRVLLDTDTGLYLESVARELEARAPGVAKMAQAAETFANEHEKGDRLAKSFEDRPVRLAVQNVIVGLGLFHHDDAFDGLAVSAWQTGEVPHVNAGEGVRGLASATLSEAFRAGGTMEIRFMPPQGPKVRDVWEHPEKAIPASLARFARTRGITLGASDPAAISPAEARALFAAVVDMPDSLRARVREASEKGVLGVERACFVVASGTWKALELEFLLACAGRVGSILRGGCDPFERPARAAELESARSAAMLGMLAARLTAPRRVGSARVLEDERSPITWEVLPDQAAVAVRAIPSGPLPWVLGGVDISDRETLLVLPRPHPADADWRYAGELAGRLGARPALLTTSDGAAGHPSGVDVASTHGAPIALVCPESLEALDRLIEARFTTCRVGRS